jgi:thiol-disulfide isomerase/thioredoxin
VEQNEPTAADDSTAADAPAAAGDAARSAPTGAAAASQRRLRLVFAAVGLAALVAVFWPRGDRAAAPGGFLVDGGGRPTPIGAELAPVTLLHFWSTWCLPCVEEAPAIARLARDLGGDSRFAVLMVAVEDDVANVRKFPGVEAADVLYDPRWEIAHRYGTRQLPETYLLVGGRVKRKFVGATDWDDPQIRAVVQGALAGASAGG